MAKKAQSKPNPETFVNENMERVSDLWSDFSNQMEK